MRSLLAPLALLVLSCASSTISVSSPRSLDTSLRVLSASWETITPRELRRTWPVHLQPYRSSSRPCEGTLQLDSRRDLNQPCTTCSSFVFALTHTQLACDQHLIDASFFLSGPQDSLLRLAHDLARSIIPSSTTDLNVVDEIPWTGHPDSATDEAVLLRRWAYSLDRDSALFFELELQRARDQTGLLRVHRADLPAPSDVSSSSPSSSTP